MKLRIIMEEISKDKLKSAGMKFVGGLDASDFDEYKAWLDQIIVSGKPRIPAELKVDYEMLKRNKDLVLDYDKKKNSEFRHDGGKYLNFLIASANQTLKRMGREKLVVLIDVLFKGSGDTVKSKKSEIRISNYVFKNDSQASESRFMEMCDELAKFLNTFTGFHGKALTGTLEIHIKSSTKQKAKASYKMEVDEIWIRESQSRDFASTAYASLKYIVTHELGHRYEQKIGKPNWFVDTAWETTRYSKTPNSWNGEQFAEIFALSFWGSAKYPEYKDKIEKFIERMS